MRAPEGELSPLGCLLCIERTFFFRVRYGQVEALVGPPHLRGTQDGQYSNRTQGRLTTLEASPSSFSVRLRLLLSGVPNAHSFLSGPPGAKPLLPCPPVDKPLFIIDVLPPPGRRLLTPWNPPSPQLQDVIQATVPVKTARTTCVEEVRTTPAQKVQTTPIQKACTKTKTKIDGEVPDPPVQCPPGRYHILPISSTACSRVARLEHSSSLEKRRLFPSLLKITSRLDKIHYTRRDVQQSESQS